MFRSLKELLSKYDLIIADKYKDFVLEKAFKEQRLSGFKSRTEPRKHEYTKEELDALYDDIYSVEI